MGRRDNANPARALLPAAFTLILVGLLALAFRARPGTNGSSSNRDNR